jgi:hypothetical protein
MSWITILPTPFSTENDEVNYVMVVETSMSLLKLASSYATFKKSNKPQKTTHDEINFAKILASPYYPIVKYENSTPELEKSTKGISKLMKTMKLPEQITDPNIACINKSLTFQIIYKDAQQNPKSKFNYCISFCYSNMSKIERKKEDINDFIIDIFSASFPDTKVSNIKIIHRGEPRFPYDPS